MYKKQDHTLLASSCINSYNKKLYKYILFIPHAAVTLSSILPFDTRGGIFNREKENRIALFFSRGKNGAHVLVHPSFIPFPVHIR